MVKKSYVMPVSNETRTRLRTGLLAGSNTGIASNPSGSDTNGKFTAGGTAGTSQGSDGPEFVPARSRSSID